MRGLVLSLPTDRFRDGFLGTVAGCFDWHASGRQTGIVGKFVFREAVLAEAWSRLAVPARSMTYDGWAPEQECWLEWVFHWCWPRLVVLYGARCEGTLTEGARRAISLESDFQGRRRHNRATAPIPKLAFRYPSFWPETLNLTAQELSTNQRLWR